MKNVPEQTNYKSQMQGDVSWKNYFKAKNGKVNLYDAFVRSARDKLISETGSVKSEEGNVLKSWRDQIIRDLANQNQISKAEEYTRFIDEVTKNNPSANKLNQLRDEWLANIDRFTDGLKKLQTDGKFNQQNILFTLRAITPRIN